MVGSPEWGLIQTLMGCIMKAAWEHRAAYIYTKARDTDTMSIRKDTHRVVRVTQESRQAYMEDAALFVTTREEALGIDTSGLVQGSVLVIIREGKMYLLDGDGGTWCRSDSGRTLEEDDA